RFHHAGSIVRDGPEVQDRVVHHVTHEMRPLAPEPFALQVPNGRLGRREEGAREMVDEDTVDLFWHATVERAQTCFDVRDGDVELGGRQATCQGRVGVTVDERPVGSFLQQDAFDAREHPAGHGSVRTARDAQVPLRWSDPELVEEDGAHVAVVVLAGVDEHLVDVRHERELARDRRCLDELRSRADDRDDLHVVNLAYRSSRTSDWVPQLRRSETAAWPRAPIVAASSGCSSNQVIARATSSGRAGSTSSPQPTPCTIERQSGKSDATTGMPADMYSKSLLGCAAT